MNLLRPIHVVSSAALLALAASAQFSQTLPAGFDTTPSGSATSWPQDSAADQKWQWHYANSNFAQSGPITITEIYVRAATATASVAAFDFPLFDVTCSEATTAYIVGAHDPVYANNLGANTVLVRSGAWTGGPVPPSGGATATWVPLGVTTPFTFDPTHGNDFVLEIDKCATTAVWGTTLDGKSGSPGLNGGNRYGSISACNTASSTANNNEYVPIVRIDYVLGGGGSVAYCTAGTTTNGCVPSISSDANPSASFANPCTVTIVGVEGQKTGIVFYGVDNTGYVPVAWGTGGTSFLCVKPPTQRTPSQSAGGTLSQCDGQLVLDWNGFLAANPSAIGAPFSSGDRVYVQGWFRDPPAVKTTNLSDALEMTYQP